MAGRGMSYVVTHQTSAGMAVHAKCSSLQEAREVCAKELIGASLVQLWEAAPEGYKGPCLLVCTRDPFGKQSPSVRYANEYKTASRARKVIEGMPRADKDLGRLSEPWPLLALPSEVKRWRTRWPG